jgi:hypothetical protein
MQQYCETLATLRGDHAWEGMETKNLNMVQGYYTRMTIKII